MKIAVISMCLMTIFFPFKHVEAIPGVTSTLPYSVECTTTKGSDVITIKVSNNYVLTSLNTSCNGNLKLSKNEYVLPNECHLSDVIFRVGKNQSTSPFKTGVYEFKASCQRDDGGMYTVTQKNLKVGDPDVKTVTAESHPTDRIELFVRNTIPKTSMTANKLKTSVPTAQLGENLFLTIVDNYKDAVLIPQTCTTSTDSSNTIDIWKLASNNCNLKPTVVIGNFQSSITTDQYPFSVLEIQAFQFAAKENAAITFKCTVKVCRNGCSKDKSKLDDCTATPGHRRRREVDDPAQSNNTIHHVTAKLLVVNDGMFYGTDGSSTSTYTLPCLMVSLLAKAIL